ncbi:MAG TPA: SOS response-associated peptidase [Pirellulales bacterium]|nr:SOS response-associated peptidase [Pirellulales bacterium]
MCGRFTRANDYFSDRARQQKFLQQLGLSEAPPLEPRYNIAPTQDIAAVRATADDGRELVVLHWGLVPSWAKDTAIGNRMVNARAETIAEKPAFRSAFRRRRCLIPADGFYEWQAQGRTKQPYLIRFKDRRLFCFAGLWEHWPKGEPPLESCTIITTDANELMATLHDRMPVIISPADYALWLDPAVEEPERLLPLLRPWAGDELEAIAVSTLVNNPRHESPQCLEPIEGGSGMLF